MYWENVHLSKNEQLARNFTVLWVSCGEMDIESSNNDACFFSSLEGDGYKKSEALLTVHHLQLLLIFSHKC